MTKPRRGFDTYFGELAQQADHYTRQHGVNKHIGAGYDLRRGENVRDTTKPKFFFILNFQKNTIKKTKMYVNFSYNNKT